MTKQERAVIEAAKEVVADLPMIEGEPVPYPFAKSLHAQKRAVDALEEAREGDRLAEMEAFTR